MGRTRSFDEADVVALAAGQFLATGYEATSLDALVQVTGLHRGSLYQAFGSKRGLFIAALRQAGTDRLTGTARTDLLLIALLELAPTDQAVREIAQVLVRELPDDAATLLGTRLIDRAGVTTQNHHDPKGTP